jgi:hypothetical protein
VSGGADDEMLPLAAKAGAGLVLMHMRGEPGTMQDAPCTTTSSRRCTSSSASVSRPDLRGMVGDQPRGPVDRLGKTWSTTCACCDRCGGSATWTRPCSWGPRASGLGALTAPRTRTGSRVRLLPRSSRRRPARGAGTRRRGDRARSASATRSPGACDRSDLRWCSPITMRATVRGGVAARLPAVFLSSEAHPGARRATGCSRQTCRAGASDVPPASRSTSARTPATWASSRRPRRRSCGARRHSTGGGVAQLLIEQRDDVRPRADRQHRVRPVATEAIGEVQVARRARDARRCRLSSCSRWLGVVEGRLPRRTSGLPRLVERARLSGLSQNPQARPAR